MSTNNVIPFDDYDRCGYCNKTDLKSNLVDYKDKLIGVLCKVHQSCFEEYNGSVDCDDDYNYDDGPFNENIDVFELPNDGPENEV